jgi:hypothetical protein
MRCRVLTLSAMCAFASAGLATQLPAVPLESRVQAALGTRPADCGFHNVPILGPPARADDLRKSVACVVEHAAKKASAWTAVRNGGFDSEIASGFMVGADGVIRYFDYDSDRLNASDGRSPLSEQPCGRLGVVETTERGAYFSCEG